MNSILGRMLRNFLIITVAIVALAILLSNSQKARDTLAPPGLAVPPGLGSDPRSGGEK